MRTFAGDRRWVMLKVMNPRFVEPAFLGVVALCTSIATLVYRPSQTPVLEVGQTFDAAGVSFEAPGHQRALVKRSRKRLGPSTQTELPSHHPNSADDTSMRFVVKGSAVLGVDHDGKELWRFESGQRIGGRPTVADGGVLFGSQDDYLYAVDRNGKLRWKFKTRGDVDASPLIDGNGDIYFGSDDGWIRSLSFEGVLRWEVDVGSFVRSAPVMHRGVLFVQTFGTRERLVALNPKDGGVRWQVLLGALDSNEIGSKTQPVVLSGAGVLVGTYQQRALLFDEHGCQLDEVAISGEPHFIVEGPSVRVIDAREEIELSTFSSR